MRRWRGRWRITLRLSALPWLPYVGCAWSRSAASISSLVSCQALSSDATTSRMNVSVSAKRTRRIAQVVREQRQCKLPRAVALVGPFEAGGTEPLHIEARVERCAVDRDHRASQASPTFIELHAVPPS